MKARIERVILKNALNRMPYFIERVNENKSWQRYLLFPRFGYTIRFDKALNKFDEILYFYKDELKTIKL